MLDPMAVFCILCLNYKLTNDNLITWLQTTTAKDNLHIMENWYGSVGINGHPNCIQNVIHRSAFSTHAAFIDQYYIILLVLDAER